MKKYITPIFTLLFCSLAALTYSQCTPVFSDDFESGGLTSWTNGSGNYTRSVTTFNPNAGTYCLELVGGSGSHRDGVYVTVPAATPSYISWYGKSSSVSQSDGYVVVGDNNINSNNGIAFAFFRDNGNITFYDGTTILSVPYIANQWYLFEMKNIDWTNKTFDVYVGGNLIQANYPFRSTTTTAITQLHCYNFTSSTAWWDDIVIGDVAPTIGLNTVDPVCFGDSTGAVALSISGGIPGYSYVWSNGDTSQSLSGVPAGTYSVVVTDSISCTTTDTVTLTEPPSITTTLMSTDPLCNGGTDGDIAYTASGGTPGYSYMWNTGDTTQNLSNLGAGSYSITVTDSVGCTQTDTTTVQEPAALATSFMVMPILCNGDSNGTLNFMTTGGTPNYSYLWSTGDTAQNLANIPAGSYSVDVTDANGCTTSDSINLMGPPVLATSGVITDELVGNDGRIDLTVMGGIGGYTFSWNTGATSEDLTGITGGNYIVTVTDSNGCMIMDTFSVGFVGISSPVEGPQVRAYPNPFQHTFTLEIDGSLQHDTQIDILDLQGRKVAEYQLAKGSTDVQQVIDMDHQPAGMYVLKLSSGNHLQTIKITKR